VTDTSVSPALQTFAIDPVHTTIEFAAKHLMISKVRGRFRQFAGSIVVPEGSDVPSSIEVTIEAASVDTHEEQRDQHLRSADFLDAEKYPQLTFRSTGFDGSGGSFRVRGDLTIHGTTREVSLETTFEGRGPDPWGNHRIGYEARTTISRKEFGLTWNQLLETGGALVGDEIRIELNVEATAQK
jgi:polyisoprenoid-binding protein YceI